MFIIESIRVRNFRAIEEARLEPLAEGITGIFGPNGAGKTTFLTALLFALYGVRPDGVTTASLRRDGASPDSECSVSVVCRHLNQTVEILREISSKGTSTLFVYVDGIEQTHTSIGDSEKWIRRRFGIDAEGFMTAFVVRQKELDLLVSAKPAPRKALIEKLAGIDNINVVVKQARSDENISKAVLDKLPGSAEEFMESAEKFEEAKQTLQLLQQALNDVSRIVDVAEKNYEKVNGAYTEAKERISFIEGLVTKHKHRVDELSQLEERLIVAKSRHSGMTAEKLEQKKQDLAEADKALEDKRDEYSAIRSNTIVAEQDSQRLRKSIEKLSAAQPPVKVEFSVQDIEDTIHGLEEERTRLIESLSTHKSELKNIEKNAEVLNDKECPVCHRTWENHDEELEKNLQLAQELKQLITGEENKSKDLREEIQQKTVERKKAESYAVENEAYLEVQKNIVELKKELKAAEKNIVPTKVLDAMKTEGINIAAARDEKHAAYTEAKTALQFADDVINLSSAIKTIKVEIPRLKDQIANEQRVVPDIKEIELELREARIELDETRNKVVQANKNMNDFNGEFYLLKNRFERAEEDWTKKSAKHKSHQQLVAITDLLDGFRKHAIARLAPELSDYATSLISEMTSGAFTEVILNDEFTPSVIDAKGVKRPAASLSGGEVSAVALALRISIAFLITNENPELLWLDEVLTAQDADRRSSMLSTIRRLPISQIVMINHTQEASDVVDKIVTLSPADSKTGKGSVIE